MPPSIPLSSSPSTTSSPVDFQQQQTKNLRRHRNDRDPTNKAAVSAPSSTRISSRSSIDGRRNRRSNTSDNSNYERRRRFRTTSAHHGTMSSTSSYPFTSSAGRETNLNINKEINYIRRGGGTKEEEREGEDQNRNDGATTTGNANGSTNTGTAMMSSPYGGYGLAGMGGMSMMPPISPMMMGGFGGVVGGPLSGLYQALYGLQNVVFSISQAVHLVGMNQQALQQAWESLSQMVDHAVSTFNEMRALEAKGQEAESEEDKQRRKRLKALRYALVFGGSWLAYKLVRHLLFQKRRNRHYPNSHMLHSSSSYPYDAASTSRAIMPSGYGMGPGSYGSGMYGNGYGGFSGGMY